MKKINLILLIIIISVSCRDEKIITEYKKEVQSLHSYISKNSDKQIGENLIGCAASSVSGLLEVDSSKNISILFLPTNTATDFKLFDMKNDTYPKENFTNYFEKDIEAWPLFGGLLKRFAHKSISEDYWCRVTFLNNDSLHICNAIRVKHSSKPTIVANDIIKLSFPQPTKPLFNWESDSDKDNVIYFQVISTSHGKDSIISATYTYEKYFQLNNLSNVVLNVHDVNPPPILKPDKVYVFILMGISEDNWMNLIAHIFFSTSDDKKN